MYSVTVSPLSNKWTNLSHSIPIYTSAPRASVAFGLLLLCKGYNPFCKGISNFFGYVFLPTYSINSWRNLITNRKCFALGLYRVLCHAYKLEWTIADLGNIQWMAGSFIMLPNSKFLETCKVIMFCLCMTFKGIFLTLHQSTTTATGTSIRETTVLCKG